MPVISGVRKKIYLPLLLVFLTSLIVRLPLYTSPFWRTPDTAEYIDVARNLVDGKGFMQSVKMTFFDNGPVVTRAYSNRLPVIPLFFSLLLRIKNNYYWLQLCLLILGAVDCSLFYLLLRRLLQPFPSLILGLMAALNPNLLINNRMLLSEQIYYLFVITAFIFFYSGLPSGRKYFLIGILSGLAFLSRPEGILLLIVFSVFNFHRWRSAMVIIFSFFLITSPYFVMKFMAGQNPFTTNHYYVLSVRSFSEGMASGFNRTYPPATTFIGRNLFWIIERISLNTLGNLSSLFGKAYLVLLWPLFIFLRREKVRSLLPLIIYATLNLFILSATWSMISEPERHLGLVYLLLLPLFGFVPSLLWQKRLWQFLLAATFCLYLVLDIHRIYWARNIEGLEGDWNPWQKSNFYSWVITHTSQNTVIASDKPNLVNIFTSRPSILLPDNLTEDHNLELYKQLFSVNIIATAHPDVMELLHQKGKYITTLDGLEIFSP